MAREHRPPAVLAIAGSDSAGAAGIQADLRTLAALGVHGLSAITAVTAQTLRHVAAIERMPLGVVAAQIDAAFAGFRVAAVKIGMLGSGAIADRVAQRLDAHAARNVVVDPVLASSSGTALVGARGVAALRRLGARADLLTPNVPEAETLLGRRLRTVADLEPAAQDLLATGARAVLLKGGHLPGRTVRDVLATRASVRRYEHPRLDVQARGTGCTLSAALAAGLARGLALDAAVAEAERFLQQALRAAYRAGAGVQRVLDHGSGGTASQFRFR